METVSSLREIRKLMKSLSTDETFAVAEELDPTQFNALIRNIEKSGNLIVLESNPEAVPRTLMVGCRD